MHNSFYIVFYLIIACWFGIYSILFFYDSRLSLKRIWLSIYAAVACCLTINYICILTINRIVYRKRFFNLQIFLIIILAYCIYDFVLILTKTKRIKLCRSIGLSSIFIFSVLYYFYPMVESIDLRAMIDWHSTTRAAYKLPSTIAFSSILIGFSLLNIVHLFGSKRNDDPERTKRSRLIIGIAVVCSFFLLMYEFYLKYFSHLYMRYFDVAVILNFMVFSAITYCQHTYFVLSIEPNAMIYKLIDKIPEALAVTNYDLKIIWYNTQFHKIFATDGKNLSGMLITDLMLSDTNPNIFKVKTRRETFIDTGDKTLNMLFISLPVYARSGDFISGVYYLQDITDFENKKNKIEKKRLVLEKEILQKTLQIRRLNMLLKKQLAEKAAQEEQNFYVLNFDASTGLCNRKTIMQKLNSLIRINNILYILYLDGDDMKMFNDMYGRKCVDELIVEIANRIVTDFDYEKVVSRFTSDEFLIILNGSCNIQEAIENLQELLSKPFNIDDKELKITISIGISIFPYDAADAESLIRFADMAMYEAKQKGKKSFSFFDTRLKVKIERDFLIAEKMKQELVNEGMKILVEPIVEFDSTGKRALYGIETVISWTYDINTTISDEFFLDIANKAGILRKYDRWMLTTAVKKTITSNFFNCNKDYKFLLAVSSKAFFSPIFFDYLLGTLSTYSLKPNQIEIEITESTLMQNPEISIKNINLCQQFGISIIIKNFGVSYSSLSYLNRLNFSKIKISKIFVAAIGKNIKDEGIIKLLIQLANRINIRVIAEGVSTAEQLRFLKENGCKYFQGPFFSQPMQLEDFLKVGDAGELVV